MDWAVDFVASPDREDIRAIRETLEAKVRRDQGQYGDAARILWELLIRVRRAKRRRWEAVTMVHMGSVYRVLRSGIAVHFFDEAMELSQAEGFRLGQLLALAERGEMECVSGRFQASIALLGQAMALLDPQDLANRRHILLDLALAHEGLADLERCKALLEEVLEIDRSLEPDGAGDDRDHYERVCAAAGGAGAR